MNRFSFSTLIGICVAISLFVFAIISSTDNYLMFLSVSSLVLVAGSTFAASLISYTTKDVLIAIKGIFGTLFHAPTNSKHLRMHAERFIEWGQIYRQQGIEKERLKAAGYADSRPKENIESLSVEQQRQANRRIVVFVRRY